MPTYQKGMPMHVLRKTFGPLSAGTPVIVISLPRKRRGKTVEPGYATVRLQTISRKLREQIQDHPVHHQLLSPFDLEADLLVARRSRS